MRYALNVTPVSGWETHLGGGLAQQQLDADGLGYMVIVGRAQAAILAVTSAGVSAVVLLGVGAGPVALISNGRGHSVIHGAGAAMADLEADGDARLIPFMGGKVAMILSAVGIGTIATCGAGLSDMDLAGDDVSSNAIAARGAGIAGMILAGLVSIPRPHVIRDSELVNVSERRLLVATDRHSIMVPRDQDGIGVPETVHINIASEKGL